MKKKTAHWVQRTHLFRKDEYVCSICGFRVDKPYATCPHCAVPMKGSEYDPSWVDEMEIVDAIFDD